MPNVKTLKLNGTTYHLPLEDHFRRHSKEEREALADSVKDGGIRREIIVYYDTDLKLPNCVLDGQGRLETAAKLKLGKKDVPVKKLGKKTTAEAYAEAKVHNDARRHDTAEAIRRRREERRAERVEKVVELRGEGKSTREIAETLDIDPKQVRRDLDAVESGDVVPSGGKPALPDAVVGRDKVRRPAKAGPDAWRAKTLESFLSADENVWRSLRLSGVKPDSTAGELFDQLEKGTSFGLNPTARGNLYLQLNHLRPRDKKAKQGRAKGYDWKSLDKAYSVIVKARTAIPAAYPDREIGQLDEYEDLARKLGNLIRDVRDVIRQKQTAAA